MNKQINKHITK